MTYLFYIWLLRLIIPNFRTLVSCHATIYQMELCARYRLVLRALLSCGLGSAPRCLSCSSDCLSVHIANICASLCMSASMSKNYPAIRRNNVSVTTSLYLLPCLRECEWLSIVAVCNVVYF